MKHIIALLIGFIIGMSCILAHAEENFTGKDKICHDIGYLSVGTGTCEDAKVLPMEYYDKDVALEKAKQSVTEENTNVNIKVDVKDLIRKIQTHSDADDIIVKSWFEKE